MNEETLTQLAALVDRAIVPVRASRQRKAEMREELRAHVVAVFEVEEASLEDEKAALHATISRFGDPDQLAGQLQESLPVSSYAAWLAERSGAGSGRRDLVNHNRLYTSLLAILGVYSLCGMGAMLLMLALPPESRPHTHFPEWTLLPLTMLNVAYFILMTAALALRVSGAPAGRRFTRITNLLFLAAPPFGTALGLYGLWKVDKEGKLS